VNFNIDPRAKDLIGREYPGTTIMKWTFQNVTVGVAKGDISRNLFEVLQVINIPDIDRIVKMGKLYKSQYPNYPLTCFLITSENVPDNVMNLANKFKIKILKP